MLPIVVNLQIIRLALIGDGKRLVKRLKFLLDLGATNLSVYTPQISTELKSFAGRVRLFEYLPQANDLISYKLVMIVGLDKEQSSILANAARNHNIMVNVEDDKEFCDFYFSSLVRRGDLLVSVSTSGKSPSVAKKIKQHIDKILHPDWGQRLDFVEKERKLWRKQGMNMQELEIQSNKLLEEKDWEF